MAIWGISVKRFVIAGWNRCIMKQLPFYIYIYFFFIFFFLGGGGGGGGLQKPILTWSGAGDTDRAGWVWVHHGHRPVMTAAPPGGRHRWWRCWGWGPCVVSLPQTCPVDARITAEADQRAERGREGAACLPPLAVLRDFPVRYWGLPEWYSYHYIFILCSEPQINCW